MPDTSNLWRREPLQWHHAKRFASLIRKGDEIECLANGLSVRASLQWAIDRGGGDSWAVMEGQQLVGVYGWTQAGACWSYWADLSPAQVKELMRVTPGYVLEMVEKSHDHGLPHLANYVWSGNREALAWLRASHCFSIDLDHHYKVGNKDFIAFKTKPEMELRRYV